MSFIKHFWKTGTKHQKLEPEELALQVSCETVNEPPEHSENDQNIANFKLKYLGTTVIEKVVGENLNLEAIKTILSNAKAAKKKLQRVNLGVSLKGIEISDAKGNSMFKVSIYRISNCSTYSVHRQVFSFISVDQHETMECHAFLCTKRKMAETVTLTVANAFSTAFEAWKVLPQTKAIQESVAINESSSSSAFEAQEGCFSNYEDDDKQLIDFDGDDDGKPEKCQKDVIWVSFDESDCTEGIETASEKRPLFP